MNGHYKIQQRSVAGQKFPVAGKTTGSDFEFRPISLEPGVSRSRNVATLPEWFTTSVVAAGSGPFSAHRRTADVAVERFIALPGAMLGAALAAVS